MYRKTQDTSKFTICTRSVIYYLSIDSHVKLYHLKLHHEATLYVVILDHTNFTINIQNWLQVYNIYMIYLLVTHNQLIACAMPFSQNNYIMCDG